ncbi:MAG: hypothetical protein NZ959_11680 [Armatimonadetes bacterium]|nr:hypothetical protein [Armatimonadota bacterium]MDW8122979.1 hypothetical protein [Armatimonadota bacterium]
MVDVGEVVVHRCRVVASRVPSHHRPVWRAELERRQDGRRSGASRCHDSRPG